jgi:hypothetical protein
LEKVLFGQSGADLSVSGQNKEIFMSTLDEIITKPAGRREFLTRIGSAGLGLAAGSLLAGCGGGSNSGSAVASSPSNDQQILNAAATAEALATTMYYNIITSPIYSNNTSSGIGGNAPDQAYLVAAYEEEINHYNVLVGAGAVPLATTFYFPTGMFTDTTGTSGGLQTTIDTLTTLESAFIAAYLYGVMAFSQTADKVLAAQIMGVECEHRALARVIANDTGLTYTTDLAGQHENVQPPTATANDIAYERTYGVTSISQIVTDLGPFVTSGATGFSTTAYTYANSTNNSQPKALVSYTGSPISPVTLDGTTPSS